MNKIKFNNVMYKLKQTTGIEMSNSISPFLAEAFMSKFDIET